VKEYEKTRMSERKLVILVWGLKFNPTNRRKPNLFKLFKRGAIDCSEHKSSSPSYLEPISQSMQKPIEGLSATLPSELYIVPLYKGAIDFSTR